MKYAMIFIAALYHRASGAKIGWKEMSETQCIPGNLAIRRSTLRQSS
jgi:hypothetical protein